MTQMTLIYCRKRIVRITLHILTVDLIANVRLFRPIHNNQQEIMRNIFYNKLADEPRIFFSIFEQLRICIL